MLLATAASLYFILGRYGWEGARAKYRKQMGRGHFIPKFLAPAMVIFFSYAAAQAPGESKVIYIIFAVAMFLRLLATDESSLPDP